MTDQCNETQAVSANDWTDDEWLAVMAKFLPNTDVAEAEQWVADQRAEDPSA